MSAVQTAWDSLEWREFCLSRARREVVARALPGAPTGYLDERWYRKADAIIAAEDAFVAGRNQDVSHGMTTREILHCLSR